MVADVEALARQLMGERGLLGQGWTFGWARTRTKMAGWCVRPLKAIVISKPYAIWNEEHAVREMLLHEIAHALTTGLHNDRWRRVFLEIGGSGETTATLRQPPRRWCLRRVREGDERRAVAR